MSDTSRELEIFNFKGLEVRSLIRDGEHWFYAIDVCKVLGLTNVSRAMNGLDEDEADITKVHSRSSNGVEQAREVFVVNEPGLYHLVHKSRKTEAVEFRRWIRRDVIPSIRKTGKYVAPDHIRQMLGLELERVELEGEADQDRWRAEAAEKRVAELEAELAKTKRALSAVLCQHPKNDEGFCIHGRACSYVG